METAINPPVDIDYPNDFKPDGWGDREKIPVPDATEVGTCVTVDLIKNNKNE